MKILWILGLVHFWLQQNQLIQLINCDVPFSKSANKAKSLSLVFQFINLIYTDSEGDHSLMNEVSFSLPKFVSIVLLEQDVMYSVCDAFRCVKEGRKKSCRRKTPVCAKAFRSRIQL